MGSFPWRWLVYSQKVKSSDIFIRDSSCVSDYALLLFGGALTTQGSTLSMCNGYASFSASSDVGTLVVALRSAMDDILQRKIENPSMDIDAEGQGLVDAVVKLLSSEQAHFASPSPRCVSPYLSLCLCLCLCL